MHIVEETLFVVNPTVRQQFRQIVSDLCDEALLIVEELKRMEQNSQSVDSHLQHLYKNNRNTVYSDILRVASRWILRDSCFFYGNCNNRRVKRSMIREIFVCNVFKLIRFKRQYVL